LVLGGIIPEGKVLYPATIVDLEPGMEAFDNNYLVRLCDASKR
jgi:hypothetical protein